MIIACSFSSCKSSGLRFNPFKRNGVVYLNRPDDFCFQNEEKFLKLIEDAEQAAEEKVEKEAEIKGQNMIIEIKSILIVPAPVVGISAEDMVRRAECM